MLDLGRAGFGAVVSGGGRRPAADGGRLQWAAAGGGRRRQYRQAAAGGGGSVKFFNNYRPGRGGHAPSGENATELTGPPRSISRRTSPVATSTSVALRSPPPTASHAPSGENATD